VRPHKAGHAGTLDPLATGVLVVCVGQATRLIEYVQRMDKEYHAAFLLGRISPSDDIETPVTELHAAPRPTRADIEAAALRFIGQIEQAPPAYSAVKVEGRRAYRLARRGEAVELAPRVVRVEAVDVIQYEYPKLELLIRCGGGVYVRAVGRDLAAALGTAGVMSELVRTRIGWFKLDDAVDPRDLDASTFADQLLPAMAAVADLPRVELTEDERAAVRQGRIIEPSAVGRRPAEFAAVDARGDLLAILKEAGGGRYKPSPNFSSPD
jgi:tRNA pseudouridine55 synthase